MYRKEHSLKWQEDQGNPERWEYNRKERYYVCPAGKRLTWRERKQEKKGSGYSITIERYEGESGKYCLMKKQGRKVNRMERWVAAVEKEGGKGTGRT